jgi:membrane-bound lytic murein transglycosylase D
MSSPFSKITRMLAVLALLAGCSEVLMRPRASTQPTPVSEAPAANVPNPANVSNAPATKPAPANTAVLALPESNFWTEMVAARRFTDCNYDPAIEGWAKRLTASPANFNANAARMQPYFDYVWRRTQALQMPSEVAFLPLVESDYRQVYGSYGSPGGWWQLMPDTGRTFHMDVSRGNDERVDPVKATDAALKLMQENAARFDNDWLLSIFAYNVGGLRIQRVLEAKGIQPGQVEHVHQLGLPQTTEDHLHRLIAWGCIFANPGRYRVTLPTPLTPTQRFTEVRISHTTPLSAMLETLGSFAPEWKNQHPLITKRGEISYAQRVLAPAGTNDALAALGDLHRYKSPTPIVVQNAVRKPVLVVNHRAVITAKPTVKRASPKGATAKRITVVPASFKVRNGDNLWTIARRFDMRVKEILALNPGVSRDTVLKLGYRLRLK